MRNKFPFFKRMGISLCGAVIGGVIGAYIALLIKSSPEHFYHSISCLCQTLIFVLLLFYLIHEITEFFMKKTPIEHVFGRAWILDTPYTYSIGEESNSSSIDAETARILSSMTENQRHFYHTLNMRDRSIYLQMERELRNPIGRITERGRR